MCGHYRHAPPALQSILSPLVQHPPLLFRIGYCMLFAPQDAVSHVDLRPSCFLHKNAVCISLAPHLQWFVVLRSTTTLDYQSALLPSPF